MCSQLWVLITPNGNVLNDFYIYIFFNRINSEKNAQTQMYANVSFYNDYYTHDVEILSMRF